MPAFRTTTVRQIALIMLVWLCLPALINHGIAIRLLAQLPEAMAQTAPQPREGAQVDVAPWGEQRPGEDTGDVELWWEDPRDLHRIMVVFAGQPPDPASVILQWWQSAWPNNRIRRDQPMGAGESGWLHLGDLYKGQWRTADASLSQDGAAWIYQFRPINQKEYSNLNDFEATYRTTMRIRLQFSGPAPKIKQLSAFTDSIWKSADIGIEWSPATKTASAREGHLEVFNGYVDHVAPLPLAAETTVDQRGHWKSYTSKQKTGGIRARFWFAESPNVNTFDHTVATVRMGELSFSFEPARVARGEPVFSPHCQCAVRKDTPPSQPEKRHESFYSAAEAAFEKSTNRSLYHRVFAEPEQSLERALAEQPAKKHRFYLPLGTEGGRQRFGVNPDGSVFCVNDRIDQPVGKDTARRNWGGSRLDFDFDLPRTEPLRREIENQCLPISHCEWDRDGIRYTETAFVTRLDEGGLGFPDMQADDTAVLMVKVTGRNLASEYRNAHLVLRLKIDGRPTPLALRDNQVLAKLPAGEVLRGMVDGPAEGNPVDNGGIKFLGNMPPGTDGSMVIKIPFITLDQPAELERLRQLEFDAEINRVKKHWLSRADAGAQILTPIPEINRFYRAHVSHLLINCGREVGANRLMARVGSFNYGVYGNESCMMITDLDRRGLHAEAERCLDTFLQYQGTVKLPGDYSTQEGIFNGARGWESGGYNQHHGWILWAMAEHYWYSGDKVWLARNAGNLIRACRWITQERARTKNLNGLRRLERGLLPPGSLEDIGDWRCWLSNNGFSWWGLDAAARALADIQHPEASVLQAEASQYRTDILDAFGEARIRSPLVPLRDGSWIPQIPSEVHRRGRAFGWITVTLEGSIYLLRTGLMPANDPLAVPIMQDFEDNLYLSEQYGYSWNKHGREWFSRGGISMQPNLLCSPHPYLIRDEIKHFLRAYFNAFAACYYPDTQMMTEHPLPDLGDWRGDHYKSSDEANSTYWLRLMFIDDERNDILRLGMALPRAWLSDGQQPAIKSAATRFGPMSLRFNSQAARGSISASLDPPTRRQPKQILLRFRHPDAKPIARVELDGQPWTQYDLNKEWIVLPSTNRTLQIKAFY